MVHYVDDAAEVETTRAANPDDAVMLRRPAPEMWVLWPPHLDHPIRVPNGGMPAPRYSS